MGTALANAIVGAPALRGRFLLRVHAKRRPEIDGEDAIAFTGSVRELVHACDIIIVAVRPEQVSDVVREVLDNAKDEAASPQRILISVAAGVPLDVLRMQVGKAFAVVRVMPNTLVEVGKGTFGLCGADTLAPEQKERVLTLLNALGTVIELDESKMNAFTALAGCGPGLLFHIMDSFCEAGVSIGLTREASRAISASLMSGCGMLAENTGRHPVILREQGTSPAGMTIAGLNHLDRTGTRGHLIDAVKVALEQGAAMDRETDKQKG